MRVTRLEFPSPVNFLGSSGKMLPHSHPKCGELVMLEGAGGILCRHPGWNGERVIPYSSVVWYETDGVSSEGALDEPEVSEKAPEKAEKAVAKAKAPVEEKRASGRRKKASEGPIWKDKDALQALDEKYGPRPERKFRKRAGGKK